MGEIDYKDFVLRGLCGDDRDNPIIKNWKLIDSINLMPYIKMYDDIDDVKSSVEADYNHTVWTDNDYCKNCIFNWVSRDELAKFIKSKYKVEYMEYHEVKYIRKDLPFDS